MKIADILPEVDLKKLVNSPIEYLLDIWEFIVVLLALVDLKKTEAYSLGKYKFRMKDVYYWDASTKKLTLREKRLNNLLDNEVICKNFIDIRNHYVELHFKKYNETVSNKELKRYLHQYINLYKESKIYGKKTNYRNFANSQEVVCKIIQESQAKYGNCIIIPVPYDTQEEKEIRFFEIIAYLYLNGNIKIERFCIDEENKELFLKIRILCNIYSLYGITIDKDKNVFYKGKKVKMRYDSDEFTLIKELVDNKGKIDKQKFFEQLKWGKNTERSTNRMNGLKNRVLSKLNDSGADNLEISQAGAFIELKEREG